MGATAWLSRRRLTRAKVLSLPLGGRLLRCGPTKDVNFPWVILGRALYHHALVAGRAHANRGTLSLATSEDAPNWVERLDAARRRAIERVFRRLRDEDADMEVTDELTALLTPVVKQADLAPGA